MRPTLILGVSNLDKNTIVFFPPLLNRAELLGSMKVSFRGKVLGVFILFFAFTSHVSAKVIEQVKCYSISNNKNSTINVNVGGNSITTPSPELPKNDGKSKLLILIVVLLFFVLLVFGILYPDKAETLFNSFLDFLKSFFT